MPADDRVAGRLELVRNGRVLAVGDAGLDVQPRRRDGLLDPAPLRHDGRHDLEERAVQPSAAGGAEHESPPVVAQYQRGRHERHQPLTRPLLARQVSLAQHVVEADPGAWDDDAARGSERARERRHVSVAVDDADVRRPADGLGRACLLLCLHRPGDRERRGLLVPERLEPDREQAAAARRRRVRPDLPAPVAHRERVPLDDLVAGEIRERDRDMVGDSPGEVASVEKVRPLDGQPGERVRELRNREALALTERPSRPIERVAFRRVAKQRIENQVQVPLRLVEYGPFAREPRGRRQQLGPGHGSPAGVRLPEPEPDTGDRYRRRAGEEDLLGVAEVDHDLEQLRRRHGPLGHGYEEVEQLRAPLLRVVVEEKASAAEAGEGALADPGHRGCGNRGVDGLAAGAQDVGARLGGEPVARC